MNNRSSITDATRRSDGMAKATGEALYVADLKYRQNMADGASTHTRAGGVPLGPSAGLRPDMLWGRFYRSPHPRGRIKALRLPPTSPGCTIITAAHIPAGGKNEIPLANSRDMPCLADREVRYIGQIVALVVGPDPAEVDRLTGAIEMDVDPLPLCPTMNEALLLKGGSIHGEDNVFCRVNLEEGDVETAFERADIVVEGTYETGFQEQLYMEGQGLITWREGNRIGVRGSMQCPYYVHHTVSHVLGLPHDSVRVIADTIGGGFGGKEDYPEIMAGPMALASQVTGKPVRVIMDRVEDMAYTSKRHPSRCTYRSAVDSHGRVSAMDVTVDLDAGAYETYTRIVLMRAVFHAIGVYRIPVFRIRGRGIATNTVPSGAFRGFGAPQSLFGVEMHMEELARRLGMEALEFKQRHFLKKGDSTVTGGLFRDPIILDAMVNRIEKDSGYSEKRAQYAASPGGSPNHLRGIGMSFILHGCGFTGDGEQKIIKAELALEKDQDDRVSILCAAVDFGQGPQTTLRKVVARVLGIDVEDVVFNYPDTDRVPDSGPTVASRTIMIVGYLLQTAAQELKAVWKSGRKQRVDQKYQMPPGMRWNQDELSGDSYATYGWGVNVCEVSIDTRTWETDVVGVWAVFDVGVAIDRRVVDGQIQGGMSQALGFAATEKLEIDEQGRFCQITMADYMVPTSLDFPRTAAATVDNPYPFGPFGAKGMGEMVHDGGHMAFAAAVEQAVGQPCPIVPLVPETLMNIMENRLKGGEGP